MKPNTANLPFLTERGFRPTARLRPRTALEIGPSSWGIGCETMDRDYVDFEHVGPHLGELGATQVRLQAGWAKCDPGDGMYNWEWLDRIVDSSLAQGVKPWLQTSYGNPAYPGGGGIGLAQGIPVSPEALTAWDNWVRAMVERYIDRVDTWEIWNEPDLHKAMTAEEYLAFFIRTASILRSVQPRAKVVGLALANRMDFAEAFLSGLARSGKADLLSQISFHYYPHNPDDDFELVAQLASLVQKYVPHVTMRQGETGALAENNGLFLAMSTFTWSERKQAAWNLRRLLAHHSHGYPMSLFQLADMQYTNAKGAKYEGRNAKGQLCINPDMTVAYRRPSYFMAQHVFSTFDSTYPLTALDNLSVADPVRSCAYAWTKNGEAAPSLVAWWRAADAPALETPEVDRTALAPVAFRDPVLVDFMSGMVFELPEGGGAIWANLPRLDVPLAIAERSVLSLRNLEEA
jgi:hypothetical protein